MTRRSRLGGRRRAPAAGPDDGAGDDHRHGADGLGLGEGGEQNAPLGRAVIGGLVLATVATLFSCRWFQLHAPDRARLADHIDQNAPEPANHRSFPLDLKDDSMNKNDRQHNGEIEVPGSGDRVQGITRRRRKRRLPRPPPGHPLPDWIANRRHQRRRSSASSSRQASLP